MADHLAYSGTFSRDPLAYGLDTTIRTESTQGCYIWLTENKRCIDWCSGLGSSLLGYNDPTVDMAAIPLAGQNASLSSWREPEVAELLAHKVGSHIPGWDVDDIQVRFGLSGSDAVTMAVRLAKAHTNRPRVLTFKGGYHGWHAWTVSRTPPAHGIEPQHDVVELPSYDPKYFDDGFWLGSKDNYACVVLEHPSYDLPQEFYEALGAFCDQRRALLIMDEVVTGLRYGLGGASEQYKIMPDLVCLGKSLGNGWPVSAVMGHRDIMSWFSRNDPVFCSSTFWGWPASLAAAKAVLELWDEGKVAELWSKGREVGFAWGPFVPAKGHPVRQYLEFETDDQLTFFVHRMRERGHFLNARPIFVTLAHGAKEIDSLALAARETMQEFENLGEWPGYKMPRVLFRER